MVVYPSTYAYILESRNGFTIETIITKISEYGTLENQKIFRKGYKFGLLVFSINGVILTSRTAFAADGAYIGSTLAICVIAMKSGA
jgi:hypothetical protein